jgi:hypothetical protein
MFSIAKLFWINLAQERGTIPPKRSGIGEDSSPFKCETYNRLALLAVPLVKRAEAVFSTLSRPI